MLSKRIIPCLDVRDGLVVKGVQFRDHIVMGSILDLAIRYRDEGADELVFYDISASPEGRSVDLDWITRVSKAIDIPFSVAGGIRSVASAKAVLYAGADKVSINTPAQNDPDLINALSAEFGAQCVVIGIDSAPVARADGLPQWQVYKMTGDPKLSHSEQRDTLAWVQEVQARGAGEIVLNCMNVDGVQRGYDIEQLRAVRAVCQLPLVASGGAGQVQHFVDVFVQADVDAALAASVFHSGSVGIASLKHALQSAGVPVRPC
jgi:imidazole glycerol-phosphate synthase subunit HisF